MLGLGALERMGSHGARGAVTIQNTFSRTLYRSMNPDHGVLVRRLVGRWDLRRFPRVLDHPSIPACPAGDDKHCRAWWLEEAARRHKIDTARGALFYAAAAREYGVL